MLSCFPFLVDPVSNASLSGSNSRCNLTSCLALEQPLVQTLSVCTHHREAGEGLGNRCPTRHQVLSVHVRTRKEVGMFSYPTLLVGWLKAWLLTAIEETRMLSDAKISLFMALPLLAFQQSTGT